MNHAQRIPWTLRICMRAFSIALTSLIATLSTCGAALPPPGSVPAAVESVAPERHAP